MFLETSCELLKGLKHPLQVHLRTLLTRFFHIDGAWGKGIDISTKHAIRTALSKVNINLDSILAEALTDPTKQSLKENTESAIQKGVDGVPTFFVDQESFFGQERFEDVLYCANGNLIIDTSFFHEVLNRPASATRKT